MNIAKKKIKYVRDLWNKELVQIHRDSLLTHIMDHREKLSWDVFQNPGITDIDQIFSDTLFIKRVMRDGNKDGAIKIDSKEKFEPINELFSGTKRVETDYYLAESENGTYFSEKELDVNSITDKQAFDEFIFVEKEEYERLLRSFEQYNLHTREEAERLQRENADEFRQIFENRRPPILQTREQFIERNYDVISSYYVAFLRNEIYSQVFDLRKFGELTNDPTRIMDSLRGFVKIPFTLNGPDYTEFASNARKIFKKANTKEFLIFEEGNESIFPLFVRINLEGKDIVLVPQAFTAIMFILLHVIIPNNLFRTITDKRGFDFEKDVEKKFGELGYHYIPNHEDDPKNPTLEIDGIASKDEICFVIENKNSGLPPEVESLRAKENMMADLKGIIDGKKRTTEKGERVVKDIPSLPEKVEYVKNHLSNLGLTQVSPDHVFGIVVTKNYPLISEYKGFNITVLSEIIIEKLEEFMK